MRWHPYLANQLLDINCFGLLVDKKWVLSKIMINNHHEKKVELYILKKIISTGHTKTKNYNITFSAKDSENYFFVILLVSVNSCNVIH